MEAALAQAQQAAQAGEVPIGAVLADAQGSVIAAAHNLVETQKTPLAHAEMLALATAMTATGSKYLEDCTLAVTLEPCAMCAAAIAHARVKTVVFGAYDPKSGGTTRRLRLSSAMYDGGCKLQGSHTVIG